MYGSLLLVKPLILLFLIIFVSASQVVRAQLIKLDKKDSLAKVVVHFNLEWKANNISSGTSLIASAIWPRALFSNLIRFESTQTKLLKNEVLARTGDTDISKNLQILKVFAHPYHERDIPLLTQNYMLGNAFDIKSKGSFKMGLSSIHAILLQLSGDLNQVLTIEAVALHRFDGEKRKVFLTTFINRRNGKAVSFFIIEGKI